MSYCAALYVDGKRRGRFTLGTNIKEDAERQVRELNARRDRDRLPRELTVEDIFARYLADRERSKVSAVPRIKQARALLKPHFGALLPAQIDKDLCERYIALRRNVGLGDATIRTELGYLSAALTFGVDMKLIAAKPRIWRTPQGRPRTHYLTRPEAQKLLAAAKGTPHAYLFIVLALATAGRPSHILQLTWDRVDFARGTINLDDPERDRTAKGRALVPMNEHARAALTEARRIAETPTWSSTTATTSRCSRSAAP